MKEGKVHGPFGKEQGASCCRAEDLEMRLGRWVGPGSEGVLGVKSRVG